MSAFLAEHSYDIPIEDEPETFWMLDPRAPWVGDSNRESRKQTLGGCSRSPRREN